MDQLDEIGQALIESAKKVYEATKHVGPPRDYMDIGKKLGLSSTFGMELSAAQRKVYKEWKEKHKDDRGET